MIVIGLLFFSLVFFLGMLINAQKKDEKKVKPENPKLVLSEINLKRLKDADAGNYKYSVEDYFGTPELSDLCLSPDGKYLSFIKRDVSGITGWSTVDAPNANWSDASKTVNDPCPIGYRISTRSQLQLLINNNTITRLGTWNESATNYSSGTNIGNSLFMPSAGYRSRNGQVITWRGSDGMYWSSSPSSSTVAWGLHLGNASVGIGDSRYRINGLSIRCIAE